MESAPEAHILPSRIGLFPLPNVVLFPGTSLPLHVFEERYRELVSDALASHRSIAVPRLRPGFETDYYGTPDVFEICGVGRITRHVKLEDGRYHIVLEGTARVRLSEEGSIHGYRSASVERLPEPAPESPATTAALRATLLGRLKRLAVHVSEPEASRLVQIAEKTETAGSCADVVAAALVEEPDARQRLIEMLDPTERLEVILLELQRLVEQIDPGGHSSTLN